ncbi:MAG: UvrB/UvrC motif-containing protein, partial [Phycisphaerales bacterium]|nr:UvrB/UvrC motif-containing protein [Phycisphaerales bacterium]
RRRAKQIAYNQAHGITPQTIKKAIREGIDLELKARRTAREAVGLAEDAFEVEELTAAIEAEMFEAAQSMEFEKAALLRDQVQSLRAGKFGTEKVRRSEVEKAAARGGRGRAGSNTKKGPPGAPGTKSGKRGKRA